MHRAGTFFQLVITLQRNCSVCESHFKPLPELWGEFEEAHENNLLARWVKLSVHIRYSMPCAVFWQWVAPWWQPCEGCSSCSRCCGGACLPLVPHTQCRWLRWPQCLINWKWRIRVGTEEFRVPVPWDYRQQSLSWALFIFSCLKRTEMRSLEVIGLSRVSKAMNLITLRLTAVLLVGKHCSRNTIMPS